MVGDAEATKKRLLDAATAEFAGYGIAGARVDRIAEQARANKAQIYHYFGSKDALFDAVFDAIVVNTVREVPIDPTDLPEYAGRIYDGYEDHPEIPRIATWYRLERADTTSLLDIIVQSNRHKVAAIEAAQRAGQLTTHWSAADLLGLVLTVAGMWSTMTPEFTVLFSRHSRAQRRKVITDAVATLLARAADDPTVADEPTAADGAGQARFAEGTAG
ncbi:MAG TPA: TetR family transcriptional regulator [Pseudonocardia sp.]|uniref:TetR family transcriptional regulator n=1 Tax=Pseudonocardia sp. TaxID=60912 RepID=UPI002C60E7D9|nr:TetR family transcriptional regulator [Pseudonocardia sp.]HTF47224.1 TetR family transcriptional regulator [Pseudonocardia sp.]